MNIPPPRNLYQAIEILRHVRKDITLTERILRGLHSRPNPEHQNTVEAGWIDDYIARLKLVRDYLNSSPT